MKRKNQLVQDKVQEQIKTLTMKLAELRVEHQTNEASADSIISCLQDKLLQVRGREGGNEGQLGALWINLSCCQYHHQYLQDLSLAHTNQSR